MHLSKIFIWYIKERKSTPHTILKTFNYKSNFLFVCWLFFCLKQYNIFASNVVFYIKLYIKNEHTMYYIIWKRMEEFTSSTQKTLSVDYQGRFISVWSLRQSFVKKVLSTFLHFLSLHLTCCGAGRPPTLGPQTGKETAKYDNQSYLDAKIILLKILSLQKVCWKLY